MTLAELMAEVDKIRELQALTPDVEVVSMEWTVMGEGKILFRVPDPIGYVMVRIPTGP